MSSLLGDCRRAARRLRRAPLFTVSVVLTVAVGVGAFVSVYSMLDNVLWEAMPYKDPENLAYVWRDYTWADFPRGWAGGIDVVAMREQTDAFEGVAALRAGSINLSSRDGGEPQEIPILLTSANFFDLLGVQPALGHGFSAGQDVEEADLVAVLSHDLWQQRYASDAEVIGRTIYVDDEPAEVIGVLPESFHFAMHSSLGTPSTADAYLNLRWDLSDHTGGELAALARVRPGVSAEVVRAQLDAVVEPIDREIFNGLGLRLWPAYMHEDLVKDVRPALLAIAAAATFMLLILCVNLATLLLGRAARRSHEMAVSAALGAGRSALLRDTLAESLLLTLVGGTLGLLVARAGTALIADVAVDLPRRYAVTIDFSVAAAAVVAATLLGLLAGSAPALRAARTDVAGALRRAGSRVTAARTPAAMVAVQVAISMTLLVGAGVLARSFSYLVRSDPGFDPRGVLTFRMPLTTDRYPEPSDVLGLVQRVKGEIAGLLGVTAVGIVNALPLTRDTSQSAVTFADSPTNDGSESDSLLVDWFSATPGYFEAMGIPMLAGRDFRSADAADAPAVAIIDDTLARHFFPGEDALGRTMVFFGIERTVVAVVDQGRLYDIATDDRPQLFLPLAQRPRYGLSFAVRSERDPASLAGEIAGRVRAIDADQPLADVRPMQQVVAESLNGERLSLGLIAGFALAALALATLGLYGVVSNTVTGRIREIGVRMALGASSARVRAEVIGRGMRLVLIGSVFGIAGSLATARFLESLVVGVEPTDAWAVGAACAGMALTTLVACYLPARRASSVDPQVALRGD
jgi:putative ABC transport system permease protein